MGNPERAKTASIDLFSREHVGFERRDAPLAGNLDEMPQEAGGDAQPLIVLLDDEGHFRGAFAVILPWRRCTDRTRSRSRPLRTRS